MQYDFSGDSQAQEIGKAIREKGIELVMNEVSGINSESVLGRMVQAAYWLQEK